MGTRADFYIGRGEKAEWIGSIAWDGYPGGIVPNSDKRAPWPGEWKAEPWPKKQHLFDAKNQGEFRTRFKRFCERRADVTLPADGWPWPWDDSGTTDYTYAFDGGKVYASCFGSAWFNPKKEQPEDLLESSTFPSMKDVQKTTFGPRSGLIVIQHK